MKFKHYQDTRQLRHLMSIPFLYLMAVPLVVLDIFAETYHQICFRLYGISLLNRSQYIRFDRHRLPYLTFGEKVWCEYCAYANGLLLYVSVIAAETEKYWCAIRHENKEGFVPPAHHDNFLPFGDEKGYHDFLKK